MFSSGVNATACSACPAQTQPVFSSYSQRYFEDYNCFFNSDVRCGRLDSYFGTLLLSLSVCFVLCARVCACVWLSINLSVCMHHECRPRKHRSDAPALSMQRRALSAQRPRRLLLHVPHRRAVPKLVQPRPGLLFCLLCYRSSNRLVFFSLCSAGLIVLVLLFRTAAVTKCLWTPLFLASSPAPAIVRSHALSSSFKFAF